MLIRELIQLLENKTGSLADKLWALVKKSNESRGQNLGFTLTGTFTVATKEEVDDFVKLTADEYSEEEKLDVEYMLDRFYIELESMRKT